MAEWKEPKSNYISTDEVKPEIFNNLAENEKYLKETQDTKITTTDVQNAVIPITQATSRTNLGTNESVKSVFGKIKKWFADLRTLAFKDKVVERDIDGTISTSKISGLHKVSTSGSYNDLNNKPAITKEAIGLGNVVNERQYSANNKPTKTDVGLGNVDNVKQYSASNLPDRFKGTDTRNDNQTPEWYMKNRGATSIVNEFKSCNTIGTSTLFNCIYCLVTTFVSWGDSSGGYPVQIAVASGETSKTAVRTGISLTEWSSWAMYYNTTNKPSKSDVGLGNLDNIRQFSTSIPPPYPVMSVNGMTGAVTIPTPQVVPTGIYPNMKVGDSDKLGGVNASQFVQIDSPLLQSVKISVMKINKTMSCTQSASASFDLTGEISVDTFDPSKDFFYVTAYSGNANNFWSTLSGGWSYRMGTYAQVARLNACWQSIGNMLATVHRGEVSFSENTKKFRYTVYPSYRFYGHSSYTPGTQMADTQVCVDLYLIRFR